MIGTYSGIETYYEEVGSRLAARGHQVTAYRRSYFTPDVPQHRGVLDPPAALPAGKHTETLSHSLLGTFDCLFRSFDIVQYHAIGSSPLALLPRPFGKKTVVSVRGLDWQRARWGGFARRVLQFGEWAAATCPSAACVVSYTLRGALRAGRTAKRSTAFPNAVVPATRQARTSCGRWAFRANDYVLFAGRISPEKGSTPSAGAGGRWPLLRGRKLLIAGGSSFTDDYIAEMKALAWEDVVFLGRVDRETMAELYSNCLAFMLPSAMEGLSVALLEAVSYGLPIVTTEHPGETARWWGRPPCFSPMATPRPRSGERLRRLLEDPPARGRTARRRPRPRRRPSRAGRGGRADRRFLPAGAGPTLMSRRAG